MKSDNIQPELRQKYGITGAGNPQRNDKPAEETPQKEEKEDNPASETRKLKKSKVKNNKRSPASRDYFQLYGTV